MVASWCTICANDEHRDWQLIDSAGGTVRAKQCTGCGLITMNWGETPDPTDLYDWYMQRIEEWDKWADDFLVMVDRLRYWLWRDMIVGEVGAGPGALASAIDRLGYKYIGCEPGEIIRPGMLHFPLYNGVLLQKDYRDYFLMLDSEPRQELGTLFLWHVLEHVASPDELMFMSLKSLAVGGKVILQVPQCEPQYRYPQHRHFFVEKTMETLAMKYGSELRFKSEDPERKFDLYIIERMV